VAATVGVLAELNQQVNAMEQQLSSAFEAHPDAELLRSLPGLGVVLGARVLAEFGDDPTRYGHPKARKAYAGTAPITRTSGTRQIVLARVARNRRLADACYLWAFSGLPALRVPAPAMTGSAPAAPPTIRPCGPSATGWSASSMAASATAASTTSNAPGPTTPKQPPLDTNQPWDV